MPYFLLLGKPIQSHLDHPCTALLNFTTTYQGHFWSTISVDGFTSQVACTWMIQMTLNGLSQKQKIGHLMGHYMIQF
jgi:hypothetical protein